MVVVRIDDDGDVLLATSFGSEVHPIESEQQVALTFQFAMASVTVSGPARTVSDRAVIDAAWNGGMRAWVPDGADDSPLYLIRVRPVTGEYWDMRRMKKIRALYDATRAHSNGATRATTRMFAGSPPRGL
jgi:general stress protein 26